MTKRPEGRQRISLTSLIKTTQSKLTDVETVGGQADWNISLVWILLLYKQNHNIVL